MSFRLPASPLRALLLLTTLVFPLAAFAADSDGDGIDDSTDNCPAVKNAGQADMDADGQGDACDSDIDGDTYANAQDAFPYNAAEWLDTDGDSTGNNADADDDNDGWLDGEDCTPLLAYLDCTFDTDGITTTPVGSGQDQALALHLQADGKVLVAGLANNGTNNDIAILRYTSTGALDTAFSSGGKLTVALGAGEDRATAVLSQQGDAVLVAGYSLNGTYNDIALVRHTTSGALDTTFSGDGQQLTAVGPTGDQAMAMIEQADGQVVVAGYSSNAINTDFTVARYNPDGSLDTTFAGTGAVMTPVGNGVDQAAAILQQFDGKLVVAGYASNGSNNDFALVRYNPNGSLDTGFDADGKLTTAIGSGDDAAAAIIQQADGKLLVVGSTKTGAYLDTAVVRYNTDGSLDTTFDADGKLTLATSNFADAATGVLLQADGKLLLGGYASNGSNMDISLVRLTTAGALDTSFSLDGKLLTPVGSGHDYATAMALQPDGRVVVSGYSSNGSNDDVAVLRYVIDRDTDGDGVYDTADWSPSDPAKSQNPDSDGDGVSAASDNCPTQFNTSQLDTDGDGAGNACDNDDDGDGVMDLADAFPLDAGEAYDTDSDGVGDNADNCAKVANATQDNADGDPQGDVCDNYPTDPLVVMARNGVATKEGMGFAVAMGDINGDGVADLFGSTPGATANLLKKAGIVRVVSGVDNTLLTKAFYGSLAGQRFGSAMAVVDDQNIDGTPDLVVGDPWADVTDAGGVLLKDAGKVWLYSGKNGNLIRLLAAGDTVGERFGAAVAVGDADGDGLQDLAVGSPYRDTLLKDVGRVSVFHGLAGSLLYVRDGDQAREHFGAAVAFDADYLYVGAPQRDAYVAVAEQTVKLVDAGRVSVYPVSSGTDPVVRTLDGAVKKDMLGAALAAAGEDVDGDTALDWVVGAPGSDAAGKDAGSVAIYSGLAGGALATRNGAKIGDGYGASLAWAEDVNMDAVPDIAVGAFRFDTTTVLAGKTLVTRDAGRVEVINTAALLPP